LSIFVDMNTKIYIVIYELFNEENKEFCNSALFMVMKESQLKHVGDPGHVGRYILQSNMQTNI
jgi:hypothetical protein